MTDPEFLTILRCPETGTQLHDASPALVESLNERIAAGTLRNREERIVEEALSGGLVREDGAVLYPVIDEIPILLVEESIAIESD